MMKGKTTGGSKSAVARTPNEIGRILGLTPGDIALMKYKAELSRLAVKAIRESGLQLNEIVRRSGVARSKVSAVKNGATVAVSCDLLVKIIGATGLDVQPNAA
jgi:predicted XRE-type DNA-binding protein